MPCPECEAKDREIEQLRSWSQEDEIAVITGQRDGWQAEAERLRATIARVEAVVEELRREVKRCDGVHKQVADLSDVPASTVAAQNPAVQWLRAFDAAQKGDNA